MCEKNSQEKFDWGGDVFVLTCPGGVVLGPTFPGSCLSQGLRVLTLLLI